MHIVSNTSGDLLLQTALVRGGHQRCDTILKNKGSRSPMTEAIQFVVRTAQAM